MRQGYLSILILALLGCAVTDKPVGRWSKLDEPGNSSEMRSDRAESCIPMASEVKEPIFPGAEVAFIFWPKKVPHCDSVVDTRKTGLELIMLTIAPMDEVVQWYASRLKGVRRYGYPGGKGVIFVEGGAEDFSWERDRERVSYLYIDEPRGAWLQLGYRTTIEIVHPKR